MRRKFVLTQEQRENISNRISSVILDHGYETFKEFADEYKISPQSLQNWIKDGNINLAFLFKFCDDFNIDLRWALLGEPYPKRKKPLSIL